MDGAGFQDTAADARNQLEAGNPDLALRLARQGLAMRSGDDVTLWVIRLRAASALNDMAEIAQAQAYLDALPLQPGMVMPLLTAALQQGDSARTTALITQTDASDFARSTAAAEARATLAIARGDHDGARAILVQAIDHDPGAATLYLLLADCQIATGNPFSARDVLERLLPRGAPARAVEMLAAVRCKTGAPDAALRLLADYPGVIAGSASAGVIAIRACCDLNTPDAAMGWAHHALAFHPDDRTLRDLQWEVAARIGTRTASLTAIASQIGGEIDAPFAARLALARATPHDTGAAMACLAALPQGVSTPQATPRIPARLIQYWPDTTPPALVADAMADAAACNPGFHLHHFDAATALAYLQDRGEAVAATAFATTDNPAAQASILRLAAVFHMGGIWLDAAHRCLTPFDAWIDRRHDLVVLQEPMLSIGDALLVAAPGHPVIRAALDQLADRRAVDGADWCATGAGLLSRAMVQHGLDAAGQPVPGTVIVQQAAIAAHLATIAP